MVVTFYFLRLLPHTQTKVVPPWVEEHPDVFSDPEFSVTRLSDSSDLSLLTEASSHASFTDGGGAINDLEVPVKRHEAWVRVDSVMSCMVKAT